MNRFLLVISAVALINIGSIEVADAENPKLRRAAEAGIDDQAVLDQMLAIIA